ncbi:serine/threonine protein kinase [Saccharomycopsis crataegensis]|uniref:Glycogen synthase kinase 1 n=1 Tax=Saccharomycopsis crataegensis TaxID=43959 RepID=A0AAV5QTQ6_9ASCO|nr:serine/threonine protein kinase [Saccharomycopsis crataegensis]
MSELIQESVVDGHTGESKIITYYSKKMIGHGSFGVVFQTRIKETEEVCAIKRVLQDKRFKNRELQIMNAVHHRNVVDLKYYFYQNTDNNELYLNLILEYVPETIYKASHYYLQRKTHMPIFEIKLYMYQLLRALNYIHLSNICHRDIKPQNLLLNPATGVLKLCDFGSAKILNPSEANVSYICSRYYRAPELIFAATNYTTKIDIWSVGCVMAELVIGRPLFPGDSGIDQLVEIIKILGTPTKQEIKSMNPDYMEQKFPQIKPTPLTKVLGKSASFSYVDSLANNRELAIGLLTKFLNYSPVIRVGAIDAMCDPFFDELRQFNVKLPDFRDYISNHSESDTVQYKPMPELFDFDESEIMMRPELRNVLIPSWKS